MFVTIKGGAGFHAADPALTRDLGGYFPGNLNPHPALGPGRPRPRPGPTRTHSLDGPLLLPPIFNGGPSGVWVGWEPERGQEHGMPKKTQRLRLLSGAGRGKEL